MIQTAKIREAWRDLRRNRLSPFLLVLLFIASQLTPAFAWLNRASALSDTTPMQLVSLALSGNSVDTSLEDGYLDMTGEIYEDLSGFQTAEWYYTSPSGQQTVEGDANGDPQYISQLVRFPQYSEPGVWSLTFTLVDVASNSITYTPEDLSLLGYNMDVLVVSSPADTTAPVLTSLTFDSNTVDTANSSAVLSGEAILNENLSGLNENDLYVVFTSPSGNQRTYGSVSSVGPDLVMTAHS